MSQKRGNLGLGVSRFVTYPSGLYSRQSITGVASLLHSTWWCLIRCLSLVIAKCLQSGNEVHTLPIMADLPIGML